MCEIAVLMRIFALNASKILGVNNNSKSPLADLARSSYGVILRIYILLAELSDNSPFYQTWYKDIHGLTYCIMSKPIK